MDINHNEGGLLLQNNTQNNECSSSNKKTKDTCKRLAGEDIVEVNLNKRACASPVSNLSKFMCDSTSDKLVVNDSTHLSSSEFINPLDESSSLNDGSNSIEDVNAQKDDFNQCLSPRNSPSSSGSSLPKRCKSNNENFFDVNETDKRDSQSMSSPLLMMENWSNSRDLLFRLGQHLMSLATGEFNNNQLPTNMSSPAKSEHDKQMELDELPIVSQSTPPPPHLKGVSMRGNQKYSAYYQQQRKQASLWNANTSKNSTSAANNRPNKQLKQPQTNLSPSCPSTMKKTMEPVNKNENKFLNTFVLNKLMPKPLMSPFPIRPLNSMSSTPFKSKETAFQCSCNEEFENLYIFTIHMKDTGHKPKASPSDRDIPKLVRGQDMWINSETEQTREILRCMHCQQSFRSLPELTMHMISTNHYSEIVYHDNNSKNLMNSTGDQSLDKKRRFPSNNLTTECSNGVEKKIKNLSVNEIEKSNDTSGESLKDNLNKSLSSESTKTSDSNESSALQQIESFMSKRFPKSMDSSDQIPSSTLTQQKPSSPILKKDNNEAASSPNSNISSSIEQNESDKRHRNLSESTIEYQDAIETKSSGDEKSGSELVASFGENPLSSLQKLVDTTNSSQSMTHPVVNTLNDHGKSSPPNLSPSSSTTKSDIKRDRANNGTNNMEEFNSLLNQLNDSSLDSVAKQDLMETILRMILKNSDNSKSSDKESMLNNDNLIMFITALWALKNDDSKLAKQNNASNKQNVISSASVKTLSNQTLSQKRSNGGSFVPGIPEMKLLSEKNTVSANQNSYPSNFSNKAYNMKQGMMINSNSNGLLSGLNKKAKCHFCGKPFANKGQVRLHISKNKCPCLYQQSYNAMNLQSQFGSLPINLRNPTGLANCLSNQKVFEDNFSAKDFKPTSFGGVNKLNETNAMFPNKGPAVDSVWESENIHNDHSTNNNPGKLNLFSGQGMNLFPNFLSCLLNNVKNNDNSGNNNDIQMPSTSLAQTNNTYQSDSLLKNLDILTMLSKNISNVNQDAQMNMKPENNAEKCDANFPLNRDQPTPLSQLTNFSTLLPFISMLGSNSKSPVEEMTNKHISPTKAITGDEKDSSTPNANQMNSSTPSLSNNDIDNYLTIAKQLALNSRLNNRNLNVQPGKNSK